MELFRSELYKDLPVLLTNILRLGFYVFISNGRVGQRRVTITESKVGTSVHVNRSNCL